MAMDARQREIAARAVALRAGNLSAAARELRDNSVEVSISERTLRRLAAEPAFQTLVDEHAKLIREERDEAVRLAERTRLKRDLDGSFGSRVQSMERTAWELFERLAAEIDRPDTDKKDLLQFWQKAMDFVARLKQRASPAIAEMWQAEALIRAYQAVLLEKFGAALTEDMQRAVAKRYKDILTREQEARANGESEAPSG